MNCRASLGRANAGTGACRIEWPDVTIGGGCGFLLVVVLLFFSSRSCEDPFKNLIETQLTLLVFGAWLFSLCYLGANIVVPMQKCYYCPYLFFVNGCSSAFCQYSGQFSGN